MNNEPVAWIDPRELDMAVSTSVTKNKQFDTDIPLYTHPAKTLTEQDLDKLVKDAEDEGYIDMYITGLIDGFNHARAILRKAQEK